MATGAWVETQPVRMYVPAVSGIVLAELQFNIVCALAKLPHMIKIMTAAAPMTGIDDLEVRTIYRSQALTHTHTIIIQRRILVRRFLPKTARSE